MPILTGIEVLVVLGGISLLLGLIPALFAAAKGGNFVKWWLLGGFMIASSLFAALMTWLQRRSASRKMLPR